jgi:hypothetical protein
MTKLTPHQITQLTRGLIRHSILPQLTDIFDYPSFENMAKAAEQIPDSEAILDAFCKQENSEVDDQITEIYNHILESIKEHLKEAYEVDFI